MNTESNTPAPQAAGPVWVRAQGFNIELEKLYFLRDVSNPSKKYIGRFVKLESMGVVIFLHSESNNGLKIGDVELLYESESPRQVFTREQMEKAYEQGHEDEQIDGRPFLFDKYMNTNYPIKNDV